MSNKQNDAQKYAEAVKITLQNAPAPDFIEELDAKIYREQDRMADLGYVLSGMRPHETDDTKIVLEWSKRNLTTNHCNTRKPDIADDPTMMLLGKYVGGLTRFLPSEGGNSD